MRMTGRRVACCIRRLLLRHPVRSDLRLVTSREHGDQNPGRHDILHCNSHVQEFQHCKGRVGRDQRRIYSHIPSRNTFCAQQCGPTHRKDSGDKPLLKSCPPEKNQGGSRQFIPSTTLILCTRQISGHVHPEQEFDVRLGLLELAQNEFHRFHRRHARERTAQDNHTAVFLRMIKQFLFARA
jgi:hypothetical protein